MKLERQLLINREWSNNEQTLLINREWSWKNNYCQRGMKMEQHIIDQQGMKLEQQLQGMINYWSTGKGMKLQGMKLEQQLLINREWIRTGNILINREWSYNNELLINKEWSWNNNYWSTGNEIEILNNEVITTNIDQQGMKLEQHLLINREWS